MAKRGGKLEESVTMQNGNTSDNLKSRKRNFSPQGKNRNVLKVKSL